MTPRLPQQFLRFGLVGGLCYLTGLGVLYLGTDVAGWHYLASMCLALLIANFLGWALNRKWTFASRSPELLNELARYYGVNLSSHVVTLGLMALLVGFLGWNHLVASAVIAIGLMCVNYFLHRDFSFAGSSRER